MENAFTRGMRRCEHDGAPLSLVLVNIDRMRLFNERFGHLTGDGVLRMVARKLVEGLRSQDLLVRYGGEEFALLLPKTGPEAGVRIADRLRQAVAAQAIVVSDAESEKITISCGVAGMGHDDTLPLLLAAADKAVRQAKRNGRNRVERATR
jgi:diguanylate cyclase (GGDEF)-like protein